MTTQPCSLRRHWLRLMLLLFTVLLPAPASAAEPPPLQMGVLPYLSSEQLFKNFLPLLHYLETKIKRRIIMSTAPNFKTYAQRAARGDYDIYLTAPHFALLAETTQNYHRLSRVSHELNGYVVVRHDSMIQQIEDLRGRTVITPDKLAITSMLGEQLLLKHGLSPELDYRLERSASHNNAILTVYRGGADAAITEPAVYDRFTPDIRRELRVLAKTDQVPHVMFMAHSRLSAKDYEQLKAVLLTFTRDGDGRHFFEITGLDNMVPITNADMEKLHPFIALTWERMQ
jgi:phosphonate transport system substrate-binding protein